MGNCQCSDENEDFGNGDQRRSSSLNNPRNGKFGKQAFQSKLENGESNEKAFYAHNKDEKQLSDFEVLQKVGQGNYGTVYLAQCLSEKKKKYAMKVISKSMLIDSKQKEHALNERNVLASNDHHFLLKLYYSFQTETNLYLITDFIEGGDLFLNMKYKQKFSDSDVAFYCAEILVALEYLHSKGIIYRDLKPENILLTKQGHIKLADFGLSKLKNFKDERALSKCGTPDYIAPEIAIGEEGHNEMVDIWSLGMMVYEMYHGFPPFFSKDKKKQIESCVNKDIVINTKLSLDTQDFIKALLQPDPQKRIGKTGYEELKDHPFFKNIDWGKAERGELDPPKPLGKEIIQKEVSYFNKKSYPNSEIDVGSRQEKRSFLDGFAFDHTDPVSVRETQYIMRSTKIHSTQKEEQNNKEELTAASENQLS